MGALLITYDLNKPGQNHKAILDFIKSHAWAYLSESSYAIQTNASPQSVWESISSLIDATDQVYVITLKRPYAGFGPKVINDWLEECLTY